MFLVRYLFPKEKKLIDVSKTVPILKNPKKINYAYLVLQRETSTPLGIYSTLQDAKENGMKSTYNKCVIYKYKIGESCSYLNCTVYEDS